MIVCFAHGKESGPWGTKIKALAPIAQKMGFEVLSPDFTDSMDPDYRVKKLLETIGTPTRPLVLAGSSMGGYVVTVASETLRPAGLFLMAPAFYMPGYARQEPRCFAGRTTIVHGWNDDIVPPDNVIRFSRRHGIELHLLPAGHTLNEKLHVVGRLFEDFLGEVVGGGG
jgi:predicted alpha/beta-hydrolase family hydrolase